MAGGMITFRLWPPNEDLSRVCMFVAAVAMA